MRIVIGEDEALTREGLAVMLVQAGFDVVGTTGGSTCASACVVVGSAALSRRRINIVMAAPCGVALVHAQ